MRVKKFWIYGALAALLVVGCAPAAKDSETKADPAAAGSEVAKADPNKPSVDPTQPPSDDKPTEVPKPDAAAGKTAGDTAEVEKGNTPSPKDPKDRLPKTQEPPAQRVAPSGNSAKYAGTYAYVNPKLEKMEKEAEAKKKGMDLGIDWTLTIKADGTYRGVMSVGGKTQVIDGTVQATDSEVTLSPHTMDGKPLTSKALKRALVFKLSADGKRLEAKTDVQGQATTLAFVKK